MCGTGTLRSACALISGGTRSRVYCSGWDAKIHFWHPLMALGVSGGVLLSGCGAAAATAADCEPPVRVGGSLAQLCQSKWSSGSTMVAKPCFGRGQENNAMPLYLYVNSLVCVIMYWLLLCVTILCNFPHIMSCVTCLSMNTTVIRNNFLLFLLQFHKMCVKAQHSGKYPLVASHGTLIPRVHLYQVLDETLSQVCIKPHFVFVSL